MKDIQGCHTVTLTERGSISLSGVEEVISYDESSIVMQTSMGELTLDGSGLNIVKLNLGEGQVSAEGRINALYYMDKGRKSSFFSRIFG